ncbi:LADA_0F03290g1_1 [Lachancea dasiensis]|uniref:LADA_0F03290g1_1 n=1 Tax=Lachancea dasiensis TaxID=1072105 RepID=A0A1G4JIV3_9SACH|nr:LADA_0F03290g1_1 [Lachancea dasiensis]
MPPPEDKENAFWSTSNAPVTPRHLTSRSQSFLKNVKKSPKERTGMTRRPLASKDNNRTTGLAGQKDLQAHRKRTRPIVNHAGSFIGHAGRPGQVPTLNPSGAPRIKSLVLKDSSGSRDLGDPSGESDEAEYEDDSNPLAAKLRGKLAARSEAANSHGQVCRPDSDEEQTGLLSRLSGGAGIQSLLHENSNLFPLQEGLESEGSDREVETIPPRPEPLPSIPSGYTPFTDEDIAKLRSPAALNLRLNLGDDDEDVEDTHSISKSSRLLSLDPINDSPDYPDDEDTHDNKRYHVPQADVSKAQVPLYREAEAFQIEPSYSGHGLTAEELESLLE